MASFTFGQTVRRLSTTTSCLGRKINIQKPAMPWIERRILNAVTVPLLPHETRTPPQICLEEQRKKENEKKSELQEAYEAFRTKDCLKMLSENQMVAICHVLPMTSRDFFNVRIKIHTAGMKLKFANNRWIRNAIQNSRFENLEPFFTSDNIYILCEETRLTDLMAVLKKTPEIQLLGGLVENRIMSKAAMQDAAKLPSLDIMRGELLTILSASASKTSRLLGRHQTELSSNLGQLVKQGRSGDADHEKAKDPDIVQNESNSVDGEGES
ncbi:50S ribosomal protein l10 [Plakobranchus ocellatus]|uniref:Large ribosomal subunit protein uL10m n=1 Tax=Plakobranchus ocellatus TaxID=259542 RepID=A0AAV4B4P1_9GAST|nr:50S ribosomal protein l10 [Plakobranchus ocellatus]